MVDFKPFASLSSGLLARKGQAKPAMRPQAYALTPHEDLGWNDMGHSVDVAEAQPAPEPVVRIQQAVIAGGLGISSEQPPVQPAPAAEVVSISRAKVGLVARAKAAFTLRLDPDRHLRLRLACAVGHRSAQQIVTQALDEYLNAMPEIDALAGKVPARGKN
jgi:hypothetical protein